jgi:hypothetical protein
MKHFCNARNAIMYI